jgi:hypothetical protein
MVQFSWSCRLATYSVTTNVTSSLGCFHNGSNAIGNTSVLMVDSGNFHPDQEYVFSLGVMEGTRQSYAEQNVFVFHGPVPTLDLRWVGISRCKR